MMKKEEWRDVVGFGDYIKEMYEISNRGRLRNKRTKHIHSPEKKPNGYIEYHLSNNGKDLKVRAHKLVMLAFKGECPGKEINHINHDKSDNRPENLEWVTHAENIHKAMKRNLGAYKKPYQVMCLETGEIFFSAGDAADALFGDRSKYIYINKQIYGEKKSYKGYHFKRVEDDMGKMSREKGKRGEREVANILKEYGYDAKRGVQYQGSPDSPDVIGLPGVHLEVKRTERFDLYGAMDQAMRDMAQDDSEIPVVVHRRNGMDWVAVLPFREFLELYGKASPEMRYEDALILLDELGLSERTCKNNAPVYLDFLCSECGFVHYHSEANDTGESNEWNYCPNCGAKVQRGDAE